ncbi:Periphilin-1 [Liparis tanakae]|uniref:Periphilin-1 n=1 Tax=Liparis tanakae TaxID=230148 RepID=A0A4Z2ILA4_9TELE|nr:Periphilin-1 [Liparis tanakae]
MDHPRDPQSKDAKRLIRRVRSPSRPRAWTAHQDPLGRGPRPHFPREEHPSNKPGFSNQRGHPFSPQGCPPYRREHLHATEPRDRDWGYAEHYDGGSPPGPNHASRPFVPRSSSSRDQDLHFSSDGVTSRQRRSAARSKERERSREGEEPPPAASQTVTRDQAIQKKRRQIDEVYDQECEMFGLVAKMLIAKDPTLERSIQSALQENLRDIGKRCVAAMEQFIEDYDGRETPR